MTSVTANPILAARRVRADLANPATGASSANAVGTIADLRALDVPGSLPGGVVSVFVQEHSTGTERGGGWFDWSAGYTVADDNAVHINPTGNLGAGRWVRRDWIRLGAIYVDWFGANPGDIAEAATNSAAIQAAIAFNIARRSTPSTALFPRNSVKILFGAGEYFVNPDCFAVPITNQRSMTFEGVGWYGTLLILAADGFICDWQSAGESTNMTFQGIAFHGDEYLDSNWEDGTNPGNPARGFMRFGPFAGNNLYRFYHCYFSRLATMFQFGATNNADLIKLFGCRGYRCGSFAQGENAQSVAISSYGCDYELFADSFLKWYDVPGALNGTPGFLTFEGGSIILNTPASGNNWIVETSIAGGTAGRPHAAFNGTRFELRGAGPGIFKNANNASLQVHFTRCGIAISNTGAITKKLTEISLGGELIFEDCPFTQVNTGGGLPTAYDWRVFGGSAGSAQGAVVEFRRCAGQPGILPRWSDWTYDITGGTNTGYQAMIEPRQLQGLLTEGQTANAYTMTATFDRYIGRTKNPTPRHRVNLFRNGVPYNALNASTVVLPRYSVIEEIYLYVPPAQPGSTPTAITYTIADGNGVTLATIGPAAQNVGAFRKLDASNFATLDQALMDGASDLDRTIVISCSAGGGAGVLGIGHIEYS